MQLRVLVVLAVLSGCAGPPPPPPLPEGFHPPRERSLEEALERTHTTEHPAFACLIRRCPHFEEVPKDRVKLFEEAILLTRLGQTGRAIRYMHMWSLRSFGDSELGARITGEMVKIFVLRDRFGDEPIELDTELVALIPHEE